MIIQENTLEKISSSLASFEVFKVLLSNRQETEKHKEYFFVMGLNSQNECQYIDIVAIGTVNQCNTYIRECLRLAIIKNAVSIIICHNHPSGYINPSSQDTEFTKKLINACKIVEVNLLDHIIIGSDKYYSFSDKGILF